MARHMTALTFGLLFLVQFCLASDDSSSLRINFLVLSDMHLDSAETTPAMEINPRSSYGGNPRKNDIDVATFKHMLNIIKGEIKSKRDGNLIEDPEFIIVLGDIASHNRLEKVNIIRDLKTGFKILKDSFNPLPILYIFGNNDSLEAVEGPFYDADNPSGSRSPYEIAMSVGWQNGFLSSGVLCSSDGKNSKYPCLIAKSRDLKIGHYSAYVAEKLRLVALNSMLFSNKPKNKPPESVAEGELAWFGGELKKAQDNNEQVIVASHIPLGASSSEVDSKGRGYAYLKPKYEDLILKLLSKYESEVLIILAGHAHFEELKVTLHDRSINKKSEIIAITPALSTAEGNAPGFKQFYFSRKGGKWIFDDYDAIRFTKNRGDLWLEKIYDFTGQYCDVYDIFSDNNNRVTCIEQFELVWKVGENYTLDNPNLPLPLKYPPGLFIDVENSNNGNDKLSWNVLDKKRFLKNRAARRFKVYASLN